MKKKNKAAQFLIRGFIIKLQSLRWCRDGKERYRLMVQNRESRNRPKKLWAVEWMRAFGVASVWYFSHSKWWTVLSRFNLHVGVQLLQHHLLKILFSLELPSCLCQKSIDHNHGHLYLYSILFPLICVSSSNIKWSWWPQLHSKVWNQAV